MESIDPGTMSIDFKFRDFFHPLRIFRFRRFLEASQWWEPEALEAYQRRQLGRMVRHAYENVPYYRELFVRLKLHPEDIHGPEDLQRLPVLTRHDVRKNRERLVARGFQRHRPVLYRTSGTTGEPVAFYLDRNANVLEFCYYWRYWSWAGYRPGQPFADLGLQAFLDRDLEAPVGWSPFLRKLSLNAARLSLQTVETFVRAMERHRVLFLKGPPSGLHTLARLLEEKGLGVELRAVFTTGETLLPGQREAIQAAFHGPVLDSYGHMERTVGISQCPEGSYHIHPEYGVLEIERLDHLSSDAVTVGTAIGTSLHNLAMPLLRYRIGDLIEVRAGRPRCACGRSLPLCERILGRSQDLLVTRDGRYVTNAFIIFHAVPGVSWFQIVQHDLEHFELVVEADEAFTPEEESRVIRTLARLVGPAPYRGATDHEGRSRMRGRSEIPERGFPGDRGSGGMKAQFSLAKKIARLALRHPVYTRALVRKKIRLARRFPVDPAKPGERRSRTSAARVQAGAHLPVQPAVPRLFSVGRGGVVPAGGRGSRDAGQNR